ncbi:50S ribosomal protein L24 [Corynebacterium otitidis]
MKIRKGDMVQVISGPDKGAQGKVLEARPKVERVIVEGVNRVTKHVANRTGDPNAEDTGIVTKEAPIHVSNVMLLDSDGNPTRVGYRFDEDGKKVRVSRRNGKDI